MLKLMARTDPLLPTRSMLLPLSSVRNRSATSTSKSTLPVTSLVLNSFSYIKVIVWYSLSAMNGAGLAVGIIPEGNAASAEESVG